MSRWVLGKMTLASGQHSLKYCVK